MDNGNYVGDEQGRELSGVEIAMKFDAEADSVGNMNCRKGDKVSKSFRRTRREEIDGLLNEGKIGIEKARTIEDLGGTFNL